jgi:hypothetical protein
MAGIVCGVLSQRLSWRSYSKRDLQATPGRRLGRGRPWLDWLPPEDRPLSRAMLKCPRHLARTVVAFTPDLHALGCQHLVQPDQIPLGDAGVIQVALALAEQLLHP